MEIDPKYRTPAIIGGVALAAALIAGIITWVVIAGDDDDDDAASPDASASASASVSATASPSVTESPTPSASPTESATATATSGTPTPPPAAAIPFTVGAPEELPPSTLLYIEKGCWQCDGPTDSLQRQKATGAPGSITLDPRILFEATEGDQYISSTYVSPRGNEMWLTVCSGGSCGGVGEVSDDASSALHHSDDGGITWTEVETFDGAVTVVFVSAGIPLMAEVQDGGGFRYFALQSGDEVAAPEGASPVSFSNGDELLWTSEDRKQALRTDGSVVFESDREFAIIGAPHPTADIFLVQFQPPANDGTATYGLVVNGQVASEYQGPFVMTGVWIDERTVIGNADLSQVDIPGVSDKPNGLVPVRINLETGALTPLEVYGDIGNTPDYEGRNRIRGLDQGIEEATTPYLVVTPEDCLNVRDTPSQSAAVVRCWSDGVVVWVPGTEPTEAEGITWIPVVGPDTTRGWASSEFLQP